MRKALLLLICILALPPAASVARQAAAVATKNTATVNVEPKTKADPSLHFAVIGDTGTGGSAQYEVAARMASAWKVEPFNFAIMVGDNLYGGESAKDFVRKFEKPYGTLLQGGVKFYAALGNH